ncbi:hypothetical protein ABH897_002838 [Paenibacillus sp. RC73]
MPESFASMKYPFERRTKLIFTDDSLSININVNPTENRMFNDEMEKFQAELLGMFADMKEKHGMRWATLRGLEKVTMQAMLVFACMNLKKLATWLWRPGGSKQGFSILQHFIAQITRQTPEFRSEQRRFVCNLKPPSKGGFSL